MAAQTTHQSLREEIANGISHGVGFVCALVAAPILIVAAVRRGDTAGIVGASVFAAAMILLYLASTLYHAVPDPRYKRILRRCDHGAIYILIAGTYTPFTLGALRGPWGWTLFGIVWGLALVGILHKSFAGVRYPILSTVVYLGMGWIIVVAAKPLLTHVPITGLVWLFLGGMAYTGGVVFYATDHRRYNHFVWHLFVMAGTACHFVAVLFYSA